MNTASINKADVLATLRQVMDPEIDLNIVDLGLIYDVAIEGAKVSVRMTVTTPGCPMQHALESGVCSALLGLDAVEEVDVEMVFEPVWTPERISPTARAEMGFI
jgi:metal-sulfur cluster biosynthetic enzyme